MLQVHAEQDNTDLYIKKYNCGLFRKCFKYYIKYKLGLITDISHFSELLS